MGRARLPGGRVQVLLDVLLLVWTVGWLVIGVVVAYEVRGLADLSDAASKTGRAVVAVGDSMPPATTIFEPTSAPQLFASGDGSGGCGTIVTFVPSSLSRKTSAECRSRSLPPMHHRPSGVVIETP